MMSHCITYISQIISYKKLLTAYGILYTRHSVAVLDYTNNTAEGMSFKMKTRRQRKREREITN